MGSYTSLDIGEIELSWTKSYPGNHGWLFKKSDKTKEKYFYVDDNGKSIVEVKNAFSTNLSNLKLRLELAGYSKIDATFAFGFLSDINIPTTVSQRIVDLLKKVEVSKVKPNLKHAQSNSFIPKYDFGLNELNSLLSKHKIDDPLHISENIQH